MKLVDISVDNWENLLTLSTVFCVMLFINCLSTEITQLIHRNCREVLYNGRILKVIVLIYLQGK